MSEQAVEQHAAPGSVPSEEMVEPPFVKEAEALARGYWRLPESGNKTGSRPLSR
jgi:hypothetical protein